MTVSFSAAGPKGFRAGDYWVSAARTADASVERLDASPPRGVHHHYARLGIWDVDTGTVTDCRNPWPPTTTGTDCGCTACVTVESHASGQFTIQDAVNQVSQRGGTVCIGPGQYALAEPVQLINARSVCIRGHGPATVLASAGGAFVLRSCMASTIENLSIISLGKQSAITVSTAIELALERLVIVVLGGRDAHGAAISLQGVVAAASIRENAILAPVGILANDPTATAPITINVPPPSFLVAAALAIDDNVLWCQSQAVALLGIVVHLLSTRITGNEVLGCHETAISALGLGAPGSSMVISNNSVNVTGSGIRCGVDGVWIEGNKLLCSATTAAARSSDLVGISLATGLDKNGADQCQILANQISGFTEAGILIASPTRELIVKFNIIENCGNGIISGDEAHAGSVSIENNHLRNIGPSSESNVALVVGIGVVHADVATISGNTILSLGVQTVQAPLRAGILILGVLRAHIGDNEVTDVAPPGDFVGLSAGIMLRAPYAHFVVSHNRVQRDAALSNQTSNGRWFALMALGVDALDEALHAGPFTTVRVDDGRTLVIVRDRAYVWESADAAVAGTAATSPEQPRGSVLGNILNARGIASCVDVAAAGECLFSDNRVELRGPVNVPTVLLATEVAIVNANRVRGGEVSIKLLDARSAAVVGNITTGSIDIPGALQPPWDALNLRG